MIFRNMIFQLEVIKQRLPAGLVSHHEQASKANREQQHRVLWPAYNPNLATRQASTEGLFQQTRLFTAVGRVHQGRGALCTIFAPSVFAISVRKRLSASVFFFKFAS